MKKSVKQSSKLSLCCFQSLWPEDASGHCQNDTVLVSASTLEQHDFPLWKGLLWFYKLTEQTQISTNKGVIFHIRFFIMTVIVMRSIIPMLGTSTSPLFTVKLGFTILNKCVYLKFACFYQEAGHSLLVLANAFSRNHP